MQGNPDVLIVGAGLAGLSAAVALSGAGAKVTLLERKPYVGGRAYSYPHPALGEVIDSQHVLLGCCTNLIDLCRLCGAGEHIRWYDRITFLEPGDATQEVRLSHLGPDTALDWPPAPAHAAGSFLRAPMLSLHDKARIALGLARFLRGYPADDTEAFSTWLKRTGQTERAIRHFWEPVIVGALNDSFENCSTRYAAQVFYESFLKSPEGGRLGIPMQPMSEFYSAAARLAERQGATLALNASVEQLRRNSAGHWEAIARDGSSYSAPSCILALPFEQTGRLLQTLGPEEPVCRDVMPLLGRFQHAPITTLHLWFDRPVTDLEHAALLDTCIQWMFNKTLIRRAPGLGQYLELVISASFPELKRSREEILSSALAELYRFFPRAKLAVLLKSGVLKEARATFSVVPGLDAVRPGAATASAGLFLAGDWTATGWPSTMEGAVRSGRLAAGAISFASVVSNRFMTADLPAAGFMER